jgi:enoyl-CoA hydratase/carnithine racemase
MVSAALMSSDIAIAADDAVFGYPELKVGLAATAVAPTLVHQIGRRAAFEFLTLCQNITAKRALAVGMINRIVPKDALVDEARRVAEQLAGFVHDALVDDQAHHPARSRHVPARGPRHGRGRGIGDADLHGVSGSGPSLKPTASRRTAPASAPSV